MIANLTDPQPTYFPTIAPPYAPFACPHPRLLCPHKCRAALMCAQGMLALYASCQSRHMPPPYHYLQPLFRVPTKRTRTCKPPAQPTKHAPPPLSFLRSIDTPLNGRPHSRLEAHAAAVFPPSRLEFGHNPSPSSFPRLYLCLNSTPTLRPSSPSSVHPPICRTPIHPLSRRHASTDKQIPRALHPIMTKKASLYSY